jgi:hypothetical protein
MEAAVAMVVVKDWLIQCLARTAANPLVLSQRMSQQ